MFQIGDNVEVLDDVIRGKVKAITPDSVIIVTPDNFEFTFGKAEVVKVDENPSAGLSFVGREQEIRAKDTIKKIKKSSNKKEKRTPPMEVDLHIEQLTNSTIQMTNHDMLTLQIETARHKLEFAINNRIQRVVFIHGVGEGVLRSELEFLFGRYPNVTFYDAEYAKYGLGATEVYIYQKGR
ncbi:Smr/MutS family protein [Capnocytophaga canimorsus]|uniref:Smr/MutS family protein n=1 Tax=Capnocytophaga canimorsus TaxID=28188 RepID=UPI000D6E3C03|nr:Smr/MutS family protein [Capnocytophaga canimorsus]AWL78248.1 DNA mismatch repair protein MutS [Capnocytophaga canimorsus]AYW36880.1 DNA mismatch repair protein MutS [Capnocytophaga canimorsus]MDT9499578.1 DNA mismatch repair protein MutS [Capnocytophaga canimorsus]